MNWSQRVIRLAPRPRGFHLITGDVVRQCPEITQVGVGFLHIFIQHTSASLTLNENADPSVRTDFEAYFSRIVPENEPYYTHTDEGPDDMPAHLKSSILGPSLQIPISNGELLLGTWQGIYLCEHRNRAGERHLVLTVHGQAISE